LNDSYYRAASIGRGWAIVGIVFARGYFLCYDNGFTDIERF
jgi:hypothetical protein